MSETPKGPRSPLDLAPAAFGIGPPFASSATAAAAVAPLQLGFGASFALQSWLLDLGDADFAGSARALFARASETEDFTLWGGSGPNLESAPDWIVRVVGTRAVLHMSPDVMEPWMLRRDELLELVLRWFDTVKPALAAELRGSSARGATRAAAASAGALLASVLAVEIPSPDALAAALQQPLTLQRESAPMVYYQASFDAGDYARAELRFNRDTESTLLILTPRFPALSAISARELGQRAVFDGFDFSRPGQAHGQYRVDLGDRVLKLAEARPNESTPSVSVSWAARRRKAPLPACPTEAPREPQLTKVEGSKIPGRYWVELAFEAGEWLPRPALAPLPHHATRLELSNLASFPGLDAHRGDRLRARLQLEAREVRREAGSAEWRDTLHARLLDVCVLGAR